MKARDIRYKTQVILTQNIELMKTEGVGKMDRSSEYISPSPVSRVPFHQRIFQQILAPPPIRNWAELLTGFRQEKIYFLLSHFLTISLSLSNCCTVSLSYVPLPAYSPSPVTRSQSWLPDK